MITPSHRPRTVAVLALVLLVGLGVRCARADAASGDAEQRARQASDHAATQYKLGRFDRAAALYAEAYELHPVAPLLFNLGQCHRKLGNHQRAIYFFEGYLREAGDAPNRALVVDLIREERRAVANRSDRKPAPEGRTEVDDLRMRAAVNKVIAEEPPFLPAAGRDRGQERPALYERWWFWTAAGALAVAGGAYLYSADDGLHADLGVLDRR